MKRNLTLWLVLLLAALWANAQQLPSFAYNNYDGWTYNNPGVELSPTTIGQGKVTLYVNSAGLALSLVSPEFSCQGLDSIQATVRWTSRSTTVALTMAIDDSEGMPLDSVLWLPSSTASSQTFTAVLPVPRGLSDARVRFVSWNADVNNCGAITRATLVPVTSSSPEVLPGDVDNDGNVSISDVTKLISALLNGGDINQAAADVNGDGNININDITTLINRLLTGSR